MAKLSNSVESYIEWCKLMGLKPQHIENVHRYHNLLRRMNQPKWEIVAQYESGKQRSYIITDFPYNRLGKIMAGAEEDGVHLTIYRINPDTTRTLLHDNLIFKIIAKEEERQCSQNQCSGF